MKTKADFLAEIETKPLGELIKEYPLAEDFLLNMRFDDLPQNLPLYQAILPLDTSHLAEFGLGKITLLDELAAFLQMFFAEEEKPLQVGSITVCGGYDKDGVKEDIKLEIRAGEIISVVGPTGSGKSRLLGDIECLAQGDTPTGRHILLDGKALNEEERFELGGRLVAQLSQNMNFVMDLSVEDFLRLHAKSRRRRNLEEVISRCYNCANELAGERFARTTKVTQLSGGQSRALMIADVALMSSSPIVLVDEIENAGIDRRKAIRLLAKEDKIIFISTHDPLLALSADKRIVIKNGAVTRVITTAEGERAALSQIAALDDKLQNIRRHLRLGDIIEQDLAD